MVANQISTHGALLRNATNTADIPVGSTEYTQVTGHGVGAGAAVHDLTANAGKLTLARAKCYDLDPRTNGIA